MRRRKIAVVTGSRAEYGMLYPVLKALYSHSSIELKVIVTGMHLLSRFGCTVQEIEGDGFPIGARVEMPIESDSADAITSAMGAGMAGFAGAYRRLQPDVIVVLGDRFEIFAAVSAAVPFRIPVAHIHGGESTEGVFDEQFRHAITKMSHLHFPATEKHRKRIIRMGEDPRYVFCFGSPAIDNIIREKCIHEDALRKELDIPEGRRIGVFTYHPVTLEKDASFWEIDNALAALGRREGIFWVFTSTNADSGGRAITGRIMRFVKQHPGSSRYYSSLGRVKYLSLLPYAAVMVGNSSSGLTEAPSFKLPVVNIGDRQKGRIRARNVIDVKDCSKEVIAGAIDKALSARFKASLKGLKNPYGSGGASGKIARVLTTAALGDRLIKKAFYEP